MEYPQRECLAMDQQCQENTQEKMDMALLRMMMDLGYENLQPHHLVNMNLPYMAHLVLGILICAAGNNKLRL